MHRTFKKAIERREKYQIWTAMFSLHLCSLKKKNVYLGVGQVSKILVHHPDLSLSMQIIFPVSITESVPMFALSKGKALPGKSASNKGKHMDIKTKALISFWNISEKPQPQRSLRA